MSRYLWQVRLSRPGHDDFSVGALRRPNEPKKGDLFLLSRSGGRAPIQTIIVHHTEIKAHEVGLPSFTVTVKIEGDDGTGDWGK
jgi:hypothetical protein